MKKSKERGFTLIEVIFTIFLLGIIAISILPMAVYSAKYAKWNNIRLTALNLAYTQVEWLKTLDYDELGLDIIGYSPKGIVKDNYYMNGTDKVVIEDVEYGMQTSIYWEKAYSTTGEPVPQAMKKIDVVVEAKDILAGETKEYSILGSLVSREGERLPTKPGHVRVYVSLGGANEGVKNVRVGLGQLSPSAWYANTDNNGIALIGDLAEGKYIVKPTKWLNQDIMIQPNGVNNSNTEWKLEKEAIVPKWDKNKSEDIRYPQIDFSIDLPGYIKLDENINYPQSAILEIKPTSASYPPPEGENDNYMLLKTNLSKLNELKFWRLWEYVYTVKNGGERYFLIKGETGDLWDGRFNVDNFEKPTYETLKLAFGLDSNSTYRIIRNGTDQEAEVIIRFSSDVKNIDVIEFTLNGEVIDKQDYIIEQLVIGRDNAFRILLNNSFTFNGSVLDFQIINPESLVNAYGMSLSKDLNRCTLVQNI